MKYTISGSVQEAESGRGVPGVIVTAFDKDRLFDDRLGEAMTGADGEFALAYEEKAFRDLFETAPDIYLWVKTASGRLLLTTEAATRFNASANESFLLKIPAKVLRHAGIRAAQPGSKISKHFFRDPKPDDPETPPNR